MKWKKVVGWAACVIGVVLGVLGLLGIGTYVWGVIGILDASDRSWIYWGLAFLFGGIILTISGAGAVILGLQLLRSKDKK